MKTNKMTLAEVESAIKQLMGKELENYLKLGEYLGKISSERLYKSEFSSFNAYVSDRLDIKVRTAYDYISVYDRFGGNPEMYEYSFAKLRLLTALSDSEIKSLGLSPEMSVREIKNLICKDKPQDDYEEIKPDKFGALKDKLIKGCVAAFSAVDRSALKDNPEDVICDLHSAVLHLISSAFDEVIK